LRGLTALEITKLEEELREVRKFIKECKEILGSKPRRLKILQGRAFGAGARLRR